MQKRSSICTSYYYSPVAMDATMDFSSLGRKRERKW
jgi:hypothetical protein